MAVRTKHLQGPPVVELVKADAIRPSTYNPRTADPRRLKMVELSLRKLGFLMPIYADPDGEILSGHQRHYVATQMLGWDTLPVVRAPRMKLQERQAINIAFNRGTNDMQGHETPADLVKRLVGSGVVDRIERLPDVGGEERFPCAACIEWDLDRLLKLNPDMKRNRHSIVVAKVLGGAGLRLPVLVAEDGRIINGFARAAYAASNKFEKWWVVVIPQARAEYAEAMMNLLSMDFDIHNRYADNLRYNSFKRSFGGYKKWLGEAMTFALLKGKPTCKFDIRTKAHRARWISEYGTVVCDFGAGLLGETKLLQAAGIDCVPFEPFLNIGHRVCPDASRELCGQFLDRLEKGIRFHTVFATAIFNSIPFVEDRVKVLRVIAALTGRGAFHTVAPRCGNSLHMSRMGDTYRSLTAEHSNGFRLDYEPNVTLADLLKNPKVQKFHTPEEFHDLLKGSFRDVRLTADSSLIYAICRSPVIEPAALREAVEFEFDLPYPDGTRMGLAKRAKEAFSKHISVAL